MSSDYFDILNNEAQVIDKNKYGQYFTPKIVADFMVKLADVTSNSKILEPSCGEGVFLDSLIEKGYCNLTAYEIDDELSLNHNFVKYESFVSANIEQKFDLIIGNPPYIRWKNLEQELKDELTENYYWNKYFNSLCDYLYIFILKSIELLEDEGQLIFICPEYWMNTTHSLSLRNYMIKNGYFEKIYHFNETPIFDNASVSVMIFKFIKSQKRNSKINIVKYYKNKVLTIDVLNDLDNIKTTNKYIERFTVDQFEINKRWILTTEDEKEAIDKFEQLCGTYNSNINNDLFGTYKNIHYPTIGDICDIGNGMVSGLDKAFQLNGEQLNEFEKINSINVIKAKDLEPFTYNKITKYIFANDINNEDKLKRDSPVFFRKLSILKETLNRRYNYNKKIHYWQWVFLRNYNLFNSNSPRIFVPCKERISNKNYFRFAFVEGGIYPTQDVTAIFPKTNTKESIYYILAFLNNYRIFNWLKNKGIVKGNIIEFSEKPISSIPFRKINWNIAKEVEIHNKIVSLTKKYILDMNDYDLVNLQLLIDQLLESNENS